MKVLVVGAAGKTGRAVVEQSLKAGHEVTAFVHTTADYHVPGVRVMTGDGTDPAVVGNAVLGQDAVINVVGGKTPYKHTTLETTVASKIVAAMQRHGVRRLVVTSSIGVGDSTANTTLLVRLVVATFLRASTPDKAGMEVVVRGSGLDYVITRPAVLTDKPAHGQVRVFTTEGREKAQSITRADLAEFLVAQITTDDHLGETVTLGNP